MTCFNTGLAFFAFLVVISHSEEVIFFDSTFVHGENEQQVPEYALNLGANSPGDWTAPTNYSNGTVHFRLQVTEKATEVIVTYEPCLTEGGSRACADGLRFADTGVYEWSQDLEDFGGYDNIDWGSGPGSVVLIMQDADGDEVDPDGGNWVGNPYVGLYYPMTSRLSMAVVTQGDTFSGWDITPATRPQAGLRRGPVFSLTTGGELAIQRARLSREPSRLRIADARGRIVSSLEWQSNRLRETLPISFMNYNGPVVVQLQEGGQVYNQVLLPGRP